MSSRIARDSIQRVQNAHRAKVTISASLVVTAAEPAFQRNRLQYYQWLSAGRGLRCGNSVWRLCRLPVDLRAVLGGAATTHETAHMRKRTQHGQAMQQFTMGLLPSVCMLYTQ